MENALTATGRHFNAQKSLPKHGFLNLPNLCNGVLERELLVTVQKMQLTFVQAPVHNKVSLGWKLNVF